MIESYDGRFVYMIKHAGGKYAREMKWGKPKMWRSRRAAQEWLDKINESGDGMAMADIEAYRLVLVGEGEEG